MVDEMYLQKATQYYSGEYVGADENGTLYKEVSAVMIVELKESIPYVVQTIPEVAFDGNGWPTKWLVALMILQLWNLRPRCSYI